VFQVLKRTLQRGRGEFPIDTPMHDATVRIHYSAHAAAAPEGTLFSSRTDAAEGDEGAIAVEVTTGDGLLPTGVEMAIKLMLPGERCEVVVEPKFGLASCIDGVFEGLPRDEALLWKVELESFQKEVHPEVMNAEQVCASVLRGVQPPRSSACLYSNLLWPFIASTCRVWSLTASRCR
jgi:hypothetical protein